MNGGEEKEKRHYPMVIQEGAQFKPTPTANVYAGKAKAEVRAAWHGKQNDDNRIGFIKRLCRRSGC